MGTIQETPVILPHVFGPNISPPKAPPLPDPELVQRKCPHGHPTRATPIVNREGWLRDEPQGCGLCRPDEFLPYRLKGPDLVTSPHVHSGYGIAADGSVRVVNRADFKPTTITRMVPSPIVAPAPKAARVVRVVWVDVESTGLDPARHEPYEIALIADGIEQRLWIAEDDLNLAAAEPDALRISHYYTRKAEALASGCVVSGAEAAREVAIATEDAWLAGVVVSFDAAMLTKLLRKHGLVPAWYYHHLDAEVYAAGALGLVPPIGSEAIGEKLGLPPRERGDCHTALGDARYAKALFEAARLTTVAATPVTGLA